MKISLRIATKTDMPVVHKFMQDLAATLGSDAPKITLEDLYRDGGFDGDHSYFFAILAEDTELIDSNRKPVAIGFAINSYTYSWDGRTIYIRNFLVEESYRSKGVGKLLAKEVGCNRVEFDVIQKNTRAQKFYENLGAVNITEKYGYMFYRVYKDEIDKAASL